MESNITLTGSNFGRLLRQSRESLWRLMASELASQGMELNFSQFIVMKHLRNGPAMSSTLAECAAINAGAMTRVIDKLIEQGLVTRTPSLTDRRVSQVELTEQGMAFCLRVQACGEGVLKKAFKGISDDRVAELEQTLLQIIDNIESAKDNG